MYLGILSDHGFFRTDKLNQTYQTEDTTWKHLILANLTFQTLAGKGFVSKFGVKYGEFGKENPQKAIHLLQQFILENYVTKYPELERELQLQIILTKSSLMPILKNL